jgi:3' terminal RNA ribose 2'-O-methyltransferase Hen1
VILTLTTTHRPATDLGYLLRKNPARPQSFGLSFGRAHVFYPEASDDRCTFALLVEVDPVALVRNACGPSDGDFAMGQYVNDRPYAASSFLSVAISNVLGSALAGSSKERPDLVDTPMPLRASLAALPCRGGEGFLRGLFEPLGYKVTARRIPLDPAFPDWGDSPYFDVEIEAMVPVHRLLSHLYVLVPVLDNAKHYWVGDSEVAKLLRHGEGWLAGHPAQEAIARRYLRHRRDLVDDALSRLVRQDDAVATDAEQEDSVAADARSPERAMRLHDLRLAAVVDVLKGCGASRVLDLGCGEGRLLRELLKDPRFAEIVGMDVCHATLEAARERLRIDRMPEARRRRIRLLHGSLMYRDARLAGHDAAAVVEVIEHLDGPRLAAFERVVFEHAMPRTVVVTTPNREYNVLWESLPAGELRHRDHRFEWTRSEFKAWADRVASQFGYNVRTLPIGPEHEAFGAPTQMAVFTR